MSLRDIILALAVVVVWGVNFLAIKWAVTEWPPLFATGLRYTLVALPLVFFVRRPKVSLTIFVAYGVSLGVVKFGLVFSAMYLGMPVGLTSLVLQSQAFFTMALAFIFLGERLSMMNYLGIMLAISGIAAIGIDRVIGGSVAALLPLGMTVLAGFFWGVSNIVVKRAGKVDMFALVVWMGLIPPIPMFLLSYFVEGPSAFSNAFVDVSLLGAGAMGYIVLAATFFGFGVWSFLLGRYPAGIVAPFSLLVPIVGMTTGVLALGETMSPIELGGSAMVMAGLTVAMMGGRILPLIKPVSRSED